MDFLFLGRTIVVPFSDRMQPLLNSITEAEREVKECSEMATMVRGKGSSSHSILG